MGEDSLSENWKDELSKSKDSGNQIQFALKEANRVKISEELFAKFTN